MKLNLSTFNSNHRTNTKRLLGKIVCFVLIFFLLELAVGKIFTYMHYRILNQGFHTKLMWDDFYAQEKNSLDLIFSGSSHAMESFDPEIFDQKLGIRSFNMGTAAQKPQTGYYILQEALKTQKPKLVIFEAYWATMGTYYYPKQAIENAEFIEDQEIAKPSSGMA